MFIDVSYTFLIYKHKKTALYADNAVMFTFEG